MNARPIILPAIGRGRRQMKKRILAATLFMTAAAVLWSGGGQEGVGATRGKYLAGKGIIVPSEEVRVESYISSVDYRYPVPRGPLGVYLYSGHRQLSAGGQQEVIHIGIQGGRRSFYELPPMNLAFVIDKSGSMEAGKGSVMLTSYRWWSSTMRRRLSSLQHR
jgi:hypothetical protein